MGWKFQTLKTWWVTHFRGSSLDQASYIRGPWLSLHWKFCLRVIKKIGASWRARSWPQFKLRSPWEQRLGSLWDRKAGLSWSYQSLTEDRSLRANQRLSKPKHWLTRGSSSLPPSIAQIFSFPVNLPSRIWSNATMTPFCCPSSRMVNVEDVPLERPENLNAHLPNPLWVTYPNETIRQGYSGVAFTLLPLVFSRG